MKNKTRYAIVGGGAAGLSLAKILIQKGHNNVVVFEKNGNVGGKSCTIKHDGLCHEMGTCYSTLDYRKVHKWMKKAGVRRIKHQDAQINGKPFVDFVIGDKSKLKLVWELLRYYYHWRRFTNGAMLPTEYKVSTLSWLKRHKFELLERLMFRTVTTMGYGFLEEVPVYYAFNQTTPLLILSGMLGKVYEPANGWQTLWHSIAQKIDVRVNSRVTLIIRGKSGYQIEAGSGSEYFDELILTIPLDEVASITELNATEQKIVEAIEWQAYKTTLITTNEWYTNQCIRIYKQQIINRENCNMGELVAVRRTLPEKTMNRSITTSTPAYVCYQFTEGHSDEELKKKLRGDLQKEGIKNFEIIAERMWKYMPRLKSEALASGILNDMNSMQGVLGCWYSGASFSFESVRNIVDFNFSLAQKIIKSAKNKPLNTS